MKLFAGALAFIFALAISGVAAFFSITGLAALFAAAFWPVVIMGGVLESGKLVVAGWLHANWRNPNVSILHKGYLCLAVIALMLITSIGIYGYLAKGFLDQQTPLGAVGIEIAQKEQQIATDQQNIKSLNDRQAQLDAAVNSLIEQKFVMNSQKLRKSQESERADIAGQLSSLQKDVDRLSNELVPLKMSTNDVEAKLGPIKYVAELFGWTKPDIAVRMVILILMFAFDPLAVVLILSGSISVTEWMEQRKREEPKKKPATPKAPKKEEHPDPFGVIRIAQPIDTDMDVSLEKLPWDDDSDKRTILQILNRNPDSIEDVVDTVIEWHEKNTSRSKL